MSYQGIKKIFPSNKCILFLLKRNEGFMGFKEQWYEVKAFTTTPRKKIIQEEEELKALSKIIVEQDFTESGQKSHPLKVGKLKNYPNLKILLKKIDPVSDEKGE